MTTEFKVPFSIGKRELIALAKYEMGEAGTPGAPGDMLYLSEILGVSERAEKLIIHKYEWMILDAAELIMNELLFEF